VTRDRRLLALAGAVLLLAAALTGLSGAAFTAGKEEAPSVFAGGTLELSAGAAGETPLDADRMRPGQTRDAVVALRNDGTVPATLSAAVGDIDDSSDDKPLSNVLTLGLEDCGTDEACATPRALPGARLSDFTTAQIGEVAPGATRFVRVSLVWDTIHSDPARQGATLDATLVWNAVAGEAV
jgi:hypothetical protein